MITSKQITFIDDDGPMGFDQLPVSHLPPATARITCAACGVPATIPVTANGRLCSLCREDLDATAARIGANVEAINATRRAALERWDADYAHADERDQERYERVVEARGRVHDGLLKRENYEARAREALARGDGLTALLRAEAVRDEASELAGNLLADCERGLSEVEAARI